MIITLLFHTTNCSVMGNSLVMDPNSICRRSKPTGGIFAELCQNQPEIIQEVAKGARLGLRECQYQFRHQRWNCTNHGKSLGRILQQGRMHFQSCAIMFQVGQNMRVKFPGKDGFSKHWIYANQHRRV